jgi:hypothetical protein
MMFDTYQVGPRVQEVWVSETRHVGALACFRMYNPVMVLFGEAMVKLTKGNK